MSPLRYPGGKKRLAPLISSILATNNLTDRDHIDPFAGGCGLLLQLLKDKDIKHLRINDFNRGVMCFWESVLWRHEELIELIREAEVTIREWRYWKTINLKADDSDIVRLGFSTFYLNRTCRSGIIKGGPIGGFN